VDPRGRARIATTVVLVSVALSALAALYARVMIGLAREWSSSPDASYGIILVLIAVAIAPRSSSS
jgi:hypothetical protein